MAFTNYYIVLGVKNTATFEEIRTAYRELAKKYHPDKNPDNKAAEDFFKEVQQAYAVLSSPEKRRAFDLKFSYASSRHYQQPKQNHTHGAQTQYTGNAYQYAQQQAQHRQARPNAARRTPAKPDKSENNYILISIGVAMLLLYFIISYSSKSSRQRRENAVVEKYTEKTEAPAAPALSTGTPDAGPALTDAQNMYPGVFGEEVFDNRSRNQAIVYNSDASGAIVCVTDNRTGRTIRCRYVAAGSRMEFHYIPDGAYFLKIYYGTGWDPGKSFPGGTARGGFEKDIDFVAIDTGKDAMQMKQAGSGNSIRSSSYEVRLNPFDTTSETITPEAFFK